MKVFLVKSPSEEAQEVARFELDGASVRVTYARPSLAKVYKFDWIRVGDDVFKPSDGRAYYDALDRAFARQSFGWIEERT